MRIYKEFSFEAAHFLPSAPPGTPNARVHGHSFRVRVDDRRRARRRDTAYIFHFDDVGGAAPTRSDALDHRLLNEVDGLARADTRAHRDVAVGPPAEPRARARRDRDRAR